ncbi:MULTISPECIES: hypothetical protein [unclassified Bacillus (in: firmicutes)]|uniref:capping complex subunit for YIEGIA n=1 Tax=unclassified Bacillus (in: firmicutes) TaxID=185979 RepID=UPI001BE798C0|nr:MULTISPECIES: hypothetical protein [unclassified Bacillus (in: firmicutes)]MBT2637861.1 hypothetical protein [Bacillus sp. ISL-39]MBT2661033.1 hypothetical protein [Bacillus sp. ISL-45]
MAETSGGFPKFDVLAIITLSKDRVMGGKQLTLLAESEEEQKAMSQEIATTLKGDIVRLKFGDHLVVRRL